MNKLNNFFIMLNRIGGIYEADDEEHDCKGQDGCDHQSHNRKIDQEQ